MDTWIVAAFLMFLLLSGAVKARRVKSAGDFATGGKKRGLFVVTASLSAAFIGGGFSTGNAAECYSGGIANIIGLCGFSLSQILIGGVLLPRAKIPKGAQSPGEIVGAVYGRAAQVTAGVCSVLLSAGLIAAQVAAIGNIFSALLGVSYTSGVLLGFSIVIAYSVMGGMGAILTAETAEFCLLAVGIPLLAAGAARYAGGAEHVLTSLPDGFLDPLARGAAPTAALFLTMLVGEALSPTYLQRMLVGRDGRTISRATVLSGIISVPVFLLTGFVGLAARVSMPGIDPSSAMPQMVLAALPAGVKGVVTAAMLAIVMSSADGLLAAASTAAGDIIRPLSRREPDGRRMLLVMRLTAAAVGAVGMALALRSADVFSLLILAYSAWAPVMLVPTAAALLGVRAGKGVFLAAGICGGVTALAVGILSPVGGYGGTLAGTAVSFAAFAAFRGKSRSLRNSQTVGRPFGNPSD